VLLTAAKLLPNGRAIGDDIWRADQTGPGMGTHLITASRPRSHEPIVLQGAVLPQAGPSSVRIKD
jgi:hypothetical protein